MATCSSILAWEVPWAEEPGGLQSMGCRVGRDSEHADVHAGLALADHAQLGQSPAFLLFSQLC